MPVPAPDRAIFRHQRLAGTQLIQQRVAIDALGQQPDLGQRAGQGRRRFHQPRERAGAFRQRRGGAEGRQAAPMAGGRGGIALRRQRAFQRFPDRGAQRGFEARRHADGIQDRRQPIGQRARAGQFAQRRDLRPHAGQRAFGRAGRAARGLMARLRGEARGLRAFQRGAAGAQRLLGALGLGQHGQPFGIGHQGGAGGVALRDQAGLLFAQAPRGDLGGLQRGAGAGAGGLGLAGGAAGGLAAGLGGGAGGLGGFQRGARLTQRGLGGLGFALGGGAILLGHQRGAGGVALRGQARLLLRQAARREIGGLEGRAGAGLGFLGLRRCAAGGFVAGLRGGAFRLDGGKRPFGGGQRAFGFGDGGGGGLQRGLRHARFPGRALLGRERRGLVGQAPRAVGRIGLRPREGGGLGGGLGGQFGGAVGGAGGVLHGIHRLGLGGLSSGAAVGQGRGGGVEFRGLGGKARFGGGGIVPHPHGVIEVTGQRVAPPGGGVERRAGVMLLRIQRLRLHPPAFEGGAAGGLGLSRCGQAGLGGEGAARGALGLELRFGGCLAGAVMGGAGFGERRLGAGAQDGEPFDLGAAHQPREVAIPRRLPRLALQALARAFHLVQQVFGAGQVGFRLAQLQLRLMPPGAEAGDAGRFLQHRAAILGLGLDQRRDAALADHGGGSRARSDIGEHRLHVARAQFPPIDAEGAAGAAFDLARDFEFGRVGIRRRGEAGRFLQRQRDLRHVARGAGGGAGEDDIIHLAAAHGARIGLAHRPAQGFDDVGLAAAIRADDAGQPRHHLDQGGLGEGFEAGDAKPGQLRAARGLHLGLGAARFLGGLFARAFGGRRGHIHRLSAPRPRSARSGRRACCPAPRGCRRRRSAWRSRCAPSARPRALP